MAVERREYLLLAHPAACREGGRCRRDGELIVVKPVDFKVTSQWLWKCVLKMLVKGAKLLRFSDELTKVTRARGELCDTK